MRKILTRKWIKALRSGKYEQGNFYLKQKDFITDKPKYCCLGVLTEIVREGKGFGDTPIPGLNSYRDIISGYISSLASDIRKKINMTTEMMCNLIKMNDVKCNSFIEIADYLEQTLEEENKHEEVRHTGS